MSGEDPMDERNTVERMLTLRKLTRGIADKLRGDMVAHLTTVAPLLRPATIFGDFVKGGPKLVTRGAEAAFKELQALYQSIALKPPFGLQMELKPPLDVDGSSLEMIPVRYMYDVAVGGEQRRITVTSPLRWMLSYVGCGSDKLEALLKDPNRDRVELQRLVVHQLVLHIVVAKNVGVTRLLDELRLPVSSGTLPAFGALPLTYVGSAVPTVLPPDDVIVQSTELAGMDTFQEVADLDAIAALSNPYRDRLMEIVRAHGASLLSASS